LQLNPKLLGIVLQKDLKFLDFSFLFLFFYTKKKSKIWHPNQIASNMSKHFFLTIISLLQTEFSYSPNSQLSLEPMQTTAHYFFIIFYQPCLEGIILKPFFFLFISFSCQLKQIKKQRVGKHHLSPRWSHSTSTMFYPHHLVFTVMVQSCIKLKELSFTFYFIQ